MARSETGRLLSARLSAFAILFAIGCGRPATPHPAADLDEHYARADGAYRTWKSSHDCVAIAPLLGELEGFYAGHVDERGLGSGMLLSAAWEVADVRRTCGDASFRDWYRKALDRFAIAREAVRRPDGTSGTDGSLWADLGAGVAYFFVDEEIQAEWDTPKGGSARLSYRGALRVVVPKLEADDDRRERFFLALEAIRRDYQSRKYLPYLLAREATLYDVHRDAIFDADVHLFDDARDAERRDIERRCRVIIADPASSDKATSSCQDTIAKLEKGVADGEASWRAIRDQHLHDVEMRLTQRYAAAILRARRLHVEGPLVDLARKRLAAHYDVLGDTRFREFLVPRAGSPEERELRSAFPDPFDYEADVLAELKTSRI